MALKKSEFAPGTRIVFQQSAAPVGWTKDVTHNDKSLRVVSGAVSSGGSVSFSSFAAQTVGNTTLSTAQMPSHNHSVLGWYNGASTAERLNGFGGTSISVGISSSNTGGGGSHTHSLAMDMQYVDTVICVKN